MVLFLCNGQMYIIVFHKDIGEMSLWVCKLFAWKQTLDKIPCFLNLSHWNTINDNDVLCVGCVLTVNILGTCSLNAIFSLEFGAVTLGGGVFILHNIMTLLLTSHNSWVCQVAMIRMSYCDNNFVCSVLG